MAAPIAELGAGNAIGDFSDHQEIANQTDASDDDIEQYLKPRGSLAARMAAAPAQSIHDDSASDDRETNKYDSKAAGFAARMRALSNKPILDSSSSESEHGDSRMKGLSARERMKLMLQEEKEPKQLELLKPASAQIKSKNTAPSSNDDEEDVPVSHKARIRPTRTSSPTREATPDAPSLPQPAEESLFVSSPIKGPGSPTATGFDDEDVPDLTRLRGTASFKALLAKKKAERLAKEAAEEETRRLRHEKTRALIGEDSDDSEADRTMESIPNMKEWHDRHGRTKRRSRKAMEEESKETQRMARNMQLAHELKTKKKITKSSLFARFNYKAEGVNVEEPLSSSPKKVDDMGLGQEINTPATSPLTQEGHESRQGSTKHLSHSQQNSAAEEDELPSMGKVLSSSPRKPTAAEKGKGVAFPSPPWKSSPVRVSKSVRVLHPKITARVSMSANDDSDDDLEIVTRKPIKTKRDMDEIFKNVPAKKSQDSGGLHALRLLAHLTSPSKNQTNSRKKNSRPSMNPSELALALQQKARQQAAREREERMQELRAKGVHIPTAEEKEAQQNEVIDLVARAREDNANIRKEEIRAAKLANIKAGIIDPMDNDTDSEDEDWEENAMNKRETSVSESDEEADDEIELSGSEDEEMADEVDAIRNELVDHAASESENDEEDKEKGDADVANVINDDEGEPEASLPTAASRRRSRKSRIVDSDDEDAEGTPTVSVQNTPRSQPYQTPGSNKFLGKSPAVPTSVLRSATKAFIPGMPVTGAVGLGLTQIFAGTMDSQADYEGSPMPSPSQESPSQSAFDTQQDSLAFFKNLPPPGFGGFVPSTGQSDGMDVIPSSQVDIDTIPATQENGEIQAVKLTLESQSQAPDMTQDQGFSTMSPIKGRYSATPMPTIDTVVITGTPQLPETAPSVIADSITDSPIKVKKGKLRRRLQAHTTSDNDEAAEPVDDFEVTLGAFEAMRRAASAAKKGKKVRAEREEFDKQKSHAKEMVDEAATESEDEYAGLGGVSASDSDSDDEALNKEMIDETKISRADKYGIAALAAQMDREQDEAQVNKLYKDITTGGIRRKRGADYDLSDSDDDGEARRRMKRREFAKMRKALMEDENIGKIVDNPKRSAFLKSLEDREDDMDMEDWAEDEFVDADHATNSQLPADESQDTQDVSGGNSQTETSMGPPKRKSIGDQPSRLPPAMRRTRGIQEGKRASSLAEIRAEVSQLLEDHNATHFGADDSSDSELEIEDDALSVHEGLLSDDEDLYMEPQDTSIVLDEVSIMKTLSRKDKGKGKENLDPFASRRSSVAVVDRSLSRQSSDASISGTRPAFAQSSAVSSGFKVPPLLRKATGNSLSSATLSFSGEAGTAKLAAAGMGGKMSNSSKGKGFKGFAKEEQRQKVIEEGEKKRVEKRLKGVEERRKTVGGIFGKGSFE